ncbi:GntR family transcriptional regulator [Kosakonia oryzendophytica]|uniref:GntR family transcriptional regulator n=1 Tax=Kosakonia oryzendophytica TaxID=1005665 RepID=A0A1C4BRE0_9ENTR|nr:GntR family transcriptional regulator [Kosakonia oryzendophytica]AMO49516.1 putative transcriptional regulator of N-Acetylglucosamine utilization GntR family [Enterobacter sp. FY-07]TDT59606.1 GntR family transcriptional regulator [Enterobacter sp. AG5470]WBT56034.1 GntR family transcriptional regulator [Kosakonia oryzendophytica]SCC09284.1 GntR family transcriptional regulator [Kosakonia oryzendophytica]
MFESDGLPLYLKIKEIILQRIISFTYDDRLPGELLLAEEFQVARGTIKQAIDALVSIGMVYREQGKGTFINRDALLKHYTDLPDTLVSFVDPQPVHLEVISLFPSMADSVVAEKMGLSLGHQVVRLERVMMQNTQVVGHVISWLNGRIYTDISHIDGARSLHGQLRETFGYAPTRAHEQYMPVVSDNALAKQLNVAVGSPLLRIERIASNLDDVVFEYSVSHVKGASLSLRVATSQSAGNAQWSCAVSW